MRSLVTDGVRGVPRVNWLAEKTGSEDVRAPALGCEDWGCGQVLRLVARTTSQHATTTVQQRRLAFRNDLLAALSIKLIEAPLGKLAI
jgi:hypothetical protein